MGKEKAVTKSKSKGAKKKQSADPKKAKTRKSTPKSRTSKIPKKAKTKVVKTQKKSKQSDEVTLKEKIDAANAWIKRKFCADANCPHEKCIHHKFLHQTIMPLYVSHKIIPCASILPWGVLQLPVPKDTMYNLHKYGLMVGDADHKLLTGFSDGVTHYDLALIELKTEVGRLETVQKEFLAEQILAGHAMVAVCHGLNDAKVFVDAYMKKKADGKTNFYTAAQMQKFCFAGTTTEDSILAVLPAARVNPFLRERNERWKMTTEMAGNKKPEKTMEDFVTKKK